VLGGAVSAGAGRTARLDPLALPVCFTALDAAADGRVRQIEIDRERVLLRRRVRGMAIRLNLPLDAFLGVSVKLEGAPGDAIEALEATSPSVVIRLEHRDPALGVDLYAGADDPDTIAEWQLWARVLGLPLLVSDRAGRLSEPFPRLGAVKVAAPSPRRRRRSVLRRRRPSRPLRRRMGDPNALQPVYREREIIARN
jgi:hypothetical protein